MFFASDTVIQYNKLGFRIGTSVELVLGLEECYRYSTLVVFFLTAIMHFSVSCLFPGLNAPMQSSFYFVLLLLLLLLFYFLLQCVCLYVKCVNLLEMGITLLSCYSQLPLVLLTENIFLTNGLCLGTFWSNGHLSSPPSKCGVALLRQGKTWAKKWEGEKLKPKPSIDRERLE